MSEWKPIGAAPRVAGQEIIGVRFHFDEKMGPHMTKEPFISFWSPTLKKFFADPTHFIHMPVLP